MATSPVVPVARNNSRSLRYQAVFMVQPAENRASHDLQVVWNAMSMLLWRNGKIGWWGGDSGTKAGMGPASMVMLHPFFQGAAHLLLCSWDQKVQTFSTQRADYLFTHYSLVECQVVI